MCTHTIYVSSYPRMQERGTRMRVNVRPYYYMSSMYICPREKGKKKEGRECEGMSCVIYGELGYQKKIKQKK